MLGIKSIVVTHEMLQKACDIDSFKGLWAGLDAHTTGLNLIGEVARYATHFRQVLTPLQEQSFTPEMIRTLHARLSGAGGASAYKSARNVLTVGNVGTLQTADPADVEALVARLVAWVNQALESGEMHPLLVVGVFCSIFLQIAPFEAGNEKLMRFLAVVLLLRCGYTYIPYLSLEGLMDDWAEAFFTALQANQQSLEAGRPDWSGWLGFFLGLLQAHKNALHQRLYAKQKDLTHLPTLSAKIMRLFEDRQRLQMKEILALTRARRSTVKLRLQELVDSGYLIRHGQARSTWYALV